MKRIIPVILLLALVALPALAKEPITHADVWLMKRVGEPLISPDGRLVVFSVTEPAYDSDEVVRDLWVVPADGSARARRLTSTPGAEGGVAWSPDSNRIAFSAKRSGDEESQLYVLDMTGPGEAQRVTTLSTGARNPAFSPDGAAIAFESTVYPGTADDEANQAEAKRRKELKHAASRYDGFPIRHWDHWLDDRQVHLFVQSLEPDAKPRDLLAGTKLVAESGYSARPGLSEDQLHAVWAPDGQSLVFTATTRRNTAAFARVLYHLYQVGLSGGEPEPLTSGDASYGNALFTPDGRSLLCRMQRQTDYVYNLTEIVRFAWPTLGEPQVLTQGFDRSVDAVTLAAGGEDLYLLADDAGRARVYSVPIGGGDVRALDETSRGVYGGLSAPERVAGAELVARWESSAQPAEIVSIDPQTGRHAPLTALNAEAAQRIDWQPFREFWFTSSKGRRIHSWVALPPAFDEQKKYPLVLSIHGGPHASSQDSGHVRWDPHLLAAPGYVVLLTDYTGSVGYGQEFSRLIQGDPLKTPGEELIEAADEAIRLYPFIDATRQAATGASYGGHLVNWLQATTDRFKCLVSHAGLVNLESQWGTSDVIYHRELNNGGPVWEQGPTWREQNPVRHAANFKTPILLTVGENDYRVPLNQTLEAWSVLQRLRVPSRLIVFHKANHWVMQPPDAKYYWEQLHAWLEEHLSS